MDTTITDPKDKAHLLRILPLLISDKRRTIRFTHLNPLLQEPRGTCYLVELLEVEESHEVAGADGATVKIIVPSEAAPTTNARGEIEPGLKAEFKRGWIPGLILRVGNGLILNESMHSTFMPGVNTPEDLEKMKNAPPENMEIVSEQGALVRTYARQPMVYHTGEIVLIDRLARREVELQGKRYAFVEQIDILSRFQGLTINDLKVDDEGS